MKETTIPSGYSNISKYIVLVGDRALTKEDLDTTETEYLENITISTIIDQTKLYKAAYKDEESDYDKYAVFLIDSTTSKAVVTPDIAKYGIMNTPEAERKVILRKVNNTYASLQGAQFQIFRYDGTQVTSNNESTFISGANGVYFIDKLSYGVYYLHETKAPTGYADDKWFFLVISNDTADGSRDGVHVSPPYDTRDAAETAYKVYKSASGTATISKPTAKHAPPVSRKPGRRARNKELLRYDVCI